MSKKDGLTVLSKNVLFFIDGQSDIKNNTVLCLISFDASGNRNSFSFRWIPLKIDSI